MEVKLDKDNMVMLGLNKIMIDKKCKILFAVDDGSNAYGYASVDSDKDVRFLYVEKIKDYLRLNRTVDVIEIKEKDGIEYKGFSLDKFMKLLSKSNPSVLEWLNSNVVYSTLVYDFRDLLVELREFAKLYFSSKRCLFHYTGMITNDYKAHFEKELINQAENIKEKGTIKIKAKYLLGTYRALFICEYIMKNKKFPENSELVSMIPKEFYNKRDKNNKLMSDFILELIEIKKNGNKTIAEIDVPIEYIEKIKIDKEVYFNIAQNLKDKAIDFKKVNDKFLEFVEMLDKIF